LEGAGRNDDLDQLLAISWVSWRFSITQWTVPPLVHAWYYAKSRSDDTGGFVRDVDRARRVAGLRLSKAPRGSEEATQFIVLQARYVLMISSINSLAGNVPPAMLKALVTSGLWSISHAVTVARQMPAEQRLNGYALLLPFLPEPLKSAVAEEGLTTARTVHASASENLFAVLREECPHLPTEAESRSVAVAGREESVNKVTVFPGEKGISLEEGKKHVKSLTDPYVRINALVELPSRVSAEDRDAALDLATRTVIAASAVDGAHRVLWLACFGLYLLLVATNSLANDNLLPMTLFASSMVLLSLFSIIQHTKVGLRLLHTLFVRVLQSIPEGAAVRVLSVLGARAMTRDFGSRIAILVRQLALAERYHQAIRLAGIIRPFHRANALSVLVGFAPEPLIKEIVEKAYKVRRYWTTEAVNLFAPHLSAAHLMAALQLRAVREIRDREMVAEAFAGLAEHLNERQLQTLLSSRELQFPLGQAQQLLAEVARVAPPTIAPEVAELCRRHREIVRAIFGNYHIEEYASATENLALNLAASGSESKIQSALKLAAALEDPIRLPLIVNIGRFASREYGIKLLGLARTSLQRIENRALRIETWACLTAHLPSAERDEQIALLLPFVREWTCRAWESLAPYAPARLIANPAGVVRTVIRYHCDLMLADTRWMEEKVRIDPFTPPVLIAERNAERLGSRVAAALAARLASDGHTDTALLLAEGIGATDIRAKALSSVAAHCTPQARTRLAAEVKARLKAYEYSGAGAYQELRALTSIIFLLPPSEAEEFWMDWVELAVRKRRETVLEILGALGHDLLPRWGGHSACQRVAEAITTTTRWWP